MTTVAALPSSLQVERHGEVAVLRLTRAAKRNALNDPTVLGIESFFATPPEGVKAVVLDAEGEHFCAGLDLSELTERDAFEGLEHSRMWHRAFERMERGRIPVVAVLKGAVIGGGLELASATHLRVAEPSAFYALPEGQHGLFVGGGGSVRVPKLIGAHRMADMMLTGRVLDAQEGHALGLSHYLTGPGEGFAHALELAQKIATNSPVTNFAVLQALPRIVEANPTEGYLLESLVAALAGSSAAGAGAHADVPLGPRRQGPAMTAVSAPELLRPPAADGSEIARFLDWLRRERGLAFDGYDELHRWSVEDLEGFWSAVAEFYAVRFATPPERVLGRREMPGAEWFPGATLNYAEHAVGRPEDADEVAVLGVLADPRPGRAHLGQLRDQVRAGAGRAGAGSASAGATGWSAYLPNIPETLVAFLATASLGAIWASCAPEFGARSVVDRFGQIEPTVLLTVAGYGYGSKDIDRRAQVAEIRAGLPTRAPRRPGAVRGRTRCPTRWLGRAARRAR